MESATSIDDYTDRCFSHKVGEGVAACQGKMAKRTWSAIEQKWYTNILELLVEKLALFLRNTNKYFQIDNKTALKYLLKTG